MNTTPALHALLSPHDRRAIQELVTRLVAELGIAATDFILFGSKARGDATDESDIDVLVILPEAPWTVRSTLSRLAARVSLEQDVLFNLYVVSQERWTWMAQIRHPLYRSIQAEGISLLPEAAPTS